METPWKLKVQVKSRSANNFLAGTMNPVGFLSPPPSPVKSRTNGSVFKSLVPREARRSKNGSFDCREPTSPRVSCTGQVSKCKSNKWKPKELKKHMNTIGKMFKGSKRSDEKDKQSSEAIVVVKPPPCLGQINRFASGRGGALHDFDWKAFSNEKEMIPAAPEIQVNLWSRRSTTSLHR